MDLVLATRNEALHVWAGKTYQYALFIGDPQATPTPGVEVAGNGYARKDFTFATESNGELAAGTDALFDQPTGPWGTVTHVGWMDKTSGQLKGSKELAYLNGQGQTVNQITLDQNSNPLRIKAGMFKVRIPSV